MGRRLLYLIVVVVLVLGAYYGYQNYAQRKQLADGDVQCVGCMSAEEEAHFRKETASDEVNGQAEPRKAAPAAPAAQTVAARFPDGPPSVTQAPPVATPAAPAPVTTNQVATNQQTYPPPAKMGIPTGDTLPVNTPNGAAFVGKGPYQWYRQGNLTWRLNTETGASCVAYATMEEWQKPLVLHHGCAGRS